MIAIDIFIGLVIMLLYLLVPGVALSYHVFKESNFEGRLFLGAVFGLFQVYVVYFLLKNGLAVLSGWLMLVIFIVSVLSILLNKDVREKIPRRVNFI